MVAIALCIGIILGFVLGVFGAVSYAKGIVSKGDEYKLVKAVEDFRKKRNL